MKRQIFTGRLKGQRAAARAALTALVLFVLVASPSVFAQSGGLASAILNLPTTRGTGYDVPSNRIVGRLYGGNIDATIASYDARDSNFEGADRILLSITVPEGRKLPASLTFPFEGNRAEFDQWVTDNAAALLDILFPGGLAEGTAGISTSQNQSQQFLLTTALGITSARRAGETRRPEVGGLFELQQLSGDRTGRAFQGSYQVESLHLSFLGRYTSLEDNAETLSPTRTRSYSIGTDFHPSKTVNEALEWKIGVNARGGLLYSTAKTMNLGSVDFGGGVWSSVRKDFERFRIGAGAVLEGTKSRVPTVFVNEEWTFLARAINSRPLLWDVAYGALGGFVLTGDTTLNGKFLQTVPVSYLEAGRPASTIVMGSISHLVRGVTPVDVGYKFSKTGLLKGHSIFIQGYFGW
jgi:hypothetical protein